MLLCVKINSLYIIKYMKIKLLSVLAAVVFFLTPNVNFAQAPTLGTAAGYVLFTTNGALTNSGIPHLTHLTGNIGSNLAASVTGFGNVDGQTHVADAESSTCVTDLLSLYSELNAATPTASPGISIGGGDTLIAGVYAIPAAATLSGNLILNGQGNPNAIFIFQIAGPLSTTTLSNVQLINGALACNVFWKVEGLVSMAAASTMRGTIVAHNAAINMSTLDTLEGRALSINGAITVSEILAYTPIGCGSAVLTGPAAPALASTAAYGVFSSIGGVTSTPITYVTGDVGSNSTTTTGFNPLFVTGTIHPIPDASTAAAASDLTNVYNYLNTLAADIDLTDPVNFGYNLVLTPHTYLLGAATMLNGNVFLNAEGDANAVFVIRVNGAFTTSTFSNVFLINGTLEKNVYWLINGAVHIYDNSVFNGTIVAVGAITSNTGDTLNGRSLTINGDIAINGSYISITTPSCIAPAITGAMQICPGATTALSDSSAGGTWSSSNTAVAVIDSSSGIATAILPGMSTITYTSPASCVTTTALTVNPSPLPITGPNSVCVGDSITLIDLTSGGTWSSNNILLATAGSSSGVVTGIADGSPIITYTVPGTCNATATIIVGKYAGVIIGPSSVCRGSTVVLADSTIGGSWSSSNSNASVVAGVVTGISAGIDTVAYTVTNACGATTATKGITIDSTASVDSISGPSGVCAGSSILLSDSTSGGIWNSSNDRTIVVNGDVTGVSPGVDTISYAIINSCGTATAIKYVTVSPLPDEGGITGPSSVCIGSSIILTESVTGGIWSSANTTATVVGGEVTGITTGIDTIRYAVTNTCGTATATKTMFVNPSPNAGSIIGPVSVCAGSSITLTDTAAGGLWSSSNTSAAVISGVVTGLSAGMDTISYSVSNITCTITVTRPILVNAAPTPGIITGPPSVCVASVITLTDAATGGLWGTTNARAAVAGGEVTGISSGLDTVLYTVSNASCSTTATKTILINPLPDAGIISGLSSACAGSPFLLTDDVSGGVWSSSNSAATVVGGSTTGISAGIDTITYTVSNVSCTANATKSITINAMPGAGIITGPGSVCVASVITLADAATGGIWGTTNANAAVADGIVTGITSGVDTVMYTVSNASCTAVATKTIAINTLPDAGVISGPSSVCVSSSITLIESASGGTWSTTNSSATAVSGLVVGITTGVDTIVYTVNNVSCTSTATKTVTVNPFLTDGVITGLSGACIGTSITLIDTVTGGVWSSSNSTATVVLGVVSGVASGIDTIRYAVTNACGTATATKAILVSVAPAVPAIATQPPSSACTGTMYQNFGAASTAAAGTTYSWTAVNAAVWAQGTGHQYALVNFNEPGAAVVTLTASVAGSSCASHSSVTVNVGTAIAQSPDVSYFTSHFVCTPSNEDTYQWGYDNASTLDSSLLPGEINQDYLNTSPDFYNKDYWVLTTQGGCLQKTYYHIPTAIQNVSGTVAGISVYPNPTNNSINVTISAEVLGSIEVAIWNVMGQKMSTMMATNNKAVIDVSPLPTGSYLITCYNDGIKIAAARFVKN